MPCYEISLRVYLYKGNKGKESDKAASVLAEFIGVAVEKIQKGSTVQEIRVVQVGEIEVVPTPQEVEFQAWLERCKTSPVASEMDRG